MYKLHKSTLVNYKLLATAAQGTCCCNCGSGKEPNALQTYIKAQAKTNK